MVSDTQQVQPATFQDDGMEPDRTELARWPGQTDPAAPASTGIPSQSIPAKQPVPGIGGRDAR